MANVHNLHTSYHAHLTFYKIDLLHHVIVFDIQATLQYPTTIHQRQTKYLTTLIN